MRGRATARRVAAIAATVIAVGAAPHAWAKYAAPALVPPNAVVSHDDFEPREPGFQGPDWILLNSGEWLQGSVDRIRDGSLEFDSDELDDLDLDFDDIYAVVCAGPQTLSFDRREVITGEVAIRGDVVRIRTPEGVLTFHRDDVLGMVPGEPREANYWRGKLSVGLSMQRGNTDQTDFTALVNLTRETAVTRVNAKYNGAISTVQGAESANNHRANVHGDIFITRRFYVTPLSFEYYKDSFQNIDMRLTPAAGVGYKVIDRARGEISINAGAGAQYTKNLTPPPFSTDLDSTSAALISSVSFESDLTERIEWDGELKVQLGVPDTSNTNYHALSTVSIDLWADLDLDLTFVWDRNQSPDYKQDATAPGGYTKPLKNDYRLTAGLGWDF